MDILDEVQTFVEDDQSIIDAPISRKEIELANMTENEDGELVQAPWAGGQEIGDMTPDQLQEQLESSGVENVSVTDLIKMMNDPNTNVSFMESGKPRKPKISAKKKKVKKNMAKVSRRKNRKKK